MISAHFRRSCIQYSVTSSGFSFKRLMADKRGRINRPKSTEFRRRRRPSTTAPKRRSKNPTPGLVGRTTTAVVRCMLADSGLPKFLWDGLMLTAEFLGNRAPHSAIGMHSPVQQATRTGAGSAASSSRQCQGLLCISRRNPRS